MALTLAEADKYSTNQVLVGVAEITMDANPFLGLMPFVPVRGNALQYQRELAAGLPTFIAPGGTVVEAVPTTSLITTALKILIGDADIDKFLRITRSKDQDLQAELLSMKARNFADTWGDAAIYGSIDVSANEFDGVHQIIQDDITLQQVHAGATTIPGAGSFSLLDQLIDLVRPRPTVLLASRRSIRGIQQLARSQGWDLALSTMQGISRPVRFYSDIPILPADFITDTETITAGEFLAKTGGTASTIFAARLDETGLFGISADDPEAQDDLERIIQVERVGTLETRDANRWRLKSYTALCVKASQALARLDGISSAPWTN
jgi:hypothetical protein